MPTFSNSEYTDIVLVYGEAFGNAVQPQKIYTQSFPNHPTVWVHLGMLCSISEVTNPLRLQPTNVADHVRS
jgi:hypothetical protein